MKYFFLGFFGLITSVLSFEAFALTYNKYYTNVTALRAACNAEARAFTWLYSRQCSSTPTKGYFRPSQDVGHYFRMAVLGDENCTYVSDSFECSLTPPPVNCPETGTVIKRFVPSPVRDNDGEMVISFSNQYSYQGCDVVSNERDTYACYKDPSKTSIQCAALIEYTYTGFPTDDEKEVFDDSHPDSLDEPDNLLTDGDYTKDTSTQTFNDPITTSLPDGSIVETKTDVLTETKSTGITIQTTTDKKTITDTQGLIKSETTVTSITTASDGSKTVQSSTTTDYTQTPVDTTVVDIKNNTITQTTSPSLSGSQTTNTSETYDSSGNKTSSNTSTESSGSDGEPAEQDVTCESDPNGLSCINFNPSGVIGEFDTDSIEAEILTELAGLKTQIGLVRSEAEDIFDVELISSATPSCIDFITFGDVTREICLTDYQDGLAPIQLLFLFLGLMIAAFIIFR